MRKNVVLYYDKKLNYPDDPYSLPNMISTGIDFILSNIISQKPSKGWSPLKSFVNKGGTVVIKPNFVTINDAHFNLNYEKQLAVTTNKSIIIPLIEYAYRSVGGNGKIIIADSPIEASDFPKTMKKLGICDLIDYFRKKNYPIELIDLRDYRVKPIRIINNWKIGKRSLNCGMFKKTLLKGDASGYTTIDLKEDSKFRNYPKIKKLRFYKPCYKKPLEAHLNNSHKYNIANTILNADLIINLPKIKTHKIAGATLSLKNHIGLTNKKYWLPHYSEGYPPFGDQYDHKLKIAEKIHNFLRIIPIGKGNSLYFRFPIVNEQQQQAKMPIYNGSWIGNDTLWRTILDVAKIVEYSDKDGEIKNNPQRTILSILDGVIAGEGNGPLGASAKHCGILMGGLDMYKIDAIATNIMGLKKDKIKYLKNIDEKKINTVANVKIIPQYYFKPPLRWEELSAR